MQYYVATPDYYNDYMMHYGVKGMKWGVRKNPFQALGRRQARGRMGQLGIKVGKKIQARKAAKASKKVELLKAPNPMMEGKVGVQTKKLKTNGARGALSAKAGSSKSSVAKKVAIAAGVATVAALGITFLHPKYGKGNRMLAAGLIKKGAYTAASKVRDTVVKARAKQKMKDFVKAAPRIGAKKIVDVKWRDVTNTGLARTTGLAVRKNGMSTARKVAAVAGATAAAGAGAYTNYKVAQKLNQRRKDRKTNK